jgi:hypothetical protein
MLHWWKKVYSTNTDASYGRVISTAAFIAFITLNWCIAVNPWKIFDTLTYISQVNDYLFYLVLGGYSITMLKDVIKLIAARFGINLDKQDNDQT